MDSKKITLHKIRDFIQTSPILFSLGFTVLAVLLNTAFSELNYHLLPHTTWGAILDEVLFIIWPTALVVIFGFGFIFRKGSFRSSFCAALPVFLLYGFVVVSQLVTMANNPDTQWKSALEIFRGVLLLIGIGFREEILYRGVITNAIARKYGSTTKGLWITALSAGTLFGAMHLGNLFHGISLTGALTQAISTISSGVLCCAIYMRGGSIWVVALMHSLKDTPALLKMLFTNTSEDLSTSITGMISDYSPVLTMVIFFAVELLLAAFLMRKSKQQKIFDRIQQMNSSKKIES